MIHKTFMFKIHSWQIQNRFRKFTLKKDSWQIRDSFKNLGLNLFNQKFVGRNWVLPFLYPIFLCNKKNEKQAKMKNMWRKCIRIKKKMQKMQMCQKKRRAKNKSQLLQNLTWQIKKMLGKIVLKNISDGFMTYSKNVEQNFIAEHSW